MSKLINSWYLLIVLGLLSFGFSAFIGEVPYQISAYTAIPTELLFRAGANIRSAANSLADRRDLLTINKGLNQELAQLKTDKRLLELELEDLKDLVHVQENISRGAKIVAPIIGMDSSIVLTTITIGKGSSDGIKVDMPVTTAKGLVGLVTGVSQKKASIRAITDPQSRVGVTVRGAGGQGLAVGMPGDMVQVIEYLEEKPVKIGDIVETQSLGGLFPQGIAVGRVIQIPNRDPNNLRVEFAIEPMVNIRLLRNVVMIQPQ